MRSDKRLGISRSHEVGNAGGGTSASASEPATPCCGPLAVIRLATAGRAKVGNGGLNPRAKVAQIDCTGFGGQTQRDHRPAGEITSGDGSAGGAREARTGREPRGGPADRPIAGRAPRQAPRAIQGRRSGRERTRGPDCCGGREAGRNGSSRRPPPGLVLRAAADPGGNPPSRGGPDQPDRSLEKASSRQG